MSSSAERATELYQHISRFVNSDRAYSNMVGDEMIRDHPLLQAYNVGLLLDMIKVMAENPYVTAQNAKAVNKCKQIMECVGEYPEYL